MTEKNLLQFVAKVKENLMNNGFPGKKVTLPLEKMYEVADNKGLNFNDCLNLLWQEGIEHSKGEDRILFFAREVSAPVEESDLLSKAKEMMKNMSSEEMDQMRKVFEGLSDKEKENIFKKGKDMGII